MELGHILLFRQERDPRRTFLAMAEALDHLGIRQHFVVADDATARYLQRLPFTAAVDTTSWPIVANCLMSSVDLVHAHGYRAGLAGLIMTLTRGVPYVLGAQADDNGAALALQRSVRQRARALVPSGPLAVSDILELYQRAIAADSEFPEDADCR